MARLAAARGSRCSQRSRLSLASARDCRVPCPERAAPAQSARIGPNPFAHVFAQWVLHLGKPMPLRNLLCAMGAQWANPSLRILKRYAFLSNPQPIFIFTGIGIVIRSHQAIRAMRTQPPLSPSFEPKRILLTVHAPGDLLRFRAAAGSPAPVGDLPLPLLGKLDPPIIRQRAPTGSKP